MTMREKAMAGAAGLIYLRGWHHAEGIAIVQAAPLSPIEVLPDEWSSHACCHGFFHIFEGRIKSGVFALDTKLFFQLEQQRWDWVGDCVRIDHQEHTLGMPRNSVSAHAAGECRLELVYPSPSSEFIRRGDMSFDGIDEEASDWWLWLARVVADPIGREELLARWEAGI